MNGTFAFVRSQVQVWDPFSGSHHDRNDCKGFINILLHNSDTNGGRNILSKSRSLQFQIAHPDKPTLVCNDRLNHPSI